MPRPYGFNNYDDTILPPPLSSPFKGEERFFRNRDLGQEKRENPPWPYFRKQVNVGTDALISPNPNARSGDEPYISKI